MSLFGFFGGAQEEPDIAEEPAGESGLQCHHFFVNILLLNKDEVVRSTAEQKVAERLPRAKRLQKLAGRIANRKVSDEMIGQRIGEQLSTVLPEKLAEIGVDAAARTRFFQGSLVVVEISIHAVDSAVLLEAKAEEKAQTVDSALSAINMVSTSLSKYARSVLDSKVLDQVDQKIFDVLPTILEERMSERHVDVDVHTKRDVEQAAFLFDTLEAIGAPCVPAPAAADASEGS